MEKKTTIRDLTDWVRAYRDENGTLKTLATLRAVFEASGTICSTMPSAVHDRYGIDEEDVIDGFTDFAIYALGAWLETVGIVDALKLTMDSDSGEFDDVAIGAAAIRYALDVFDDLASDGEE